MEKVFTDYVQKRLKAEDKVVRYKIYLISIYRLNS